MSDPTRINDPNGNAPAVARDLVDSARADAPPPGARARALEKLEAVLANDDGNNRAGDAPPPGENADSSTSTGSNSGAGAGGTGARNENSVLFSLASLQNITGTSAPSSSASKPGADSTGAIDLRALSGPSAGRSAAADALINVGGGGPLSSPLAAPVLAPIPTPSTASSESERRPSGGNKSFMVAGVLIALILAAGGLGVAFLLKPTAPATVVVNAPPTQANNDNNGNNNNNNGNNAAAPGTTVADNTAPAPGADPAANRNDRTRDSHHEHDRDTHAQAGAAGTPATTTTAAAPPPNTSGCATRCHGNIDCLLRCTAGGGTTAPATTTAPAQGGSTPESPSRNDVISAMGRVRGAVANCASGQPGTATISITFASSGRVTSATTSGAPFAGTPAGSCMARAVRSATVPPFSRPSFSVTYPFRI